MYVEKRGRKYYAIHTIPADVRHVFNGNIRFTTRLDTSNENVARTRARLLEIKWRRLIEQARSKSTDAVERDAEFWRELLANAPEHEKALVRDAIADEARERIDRAGARLGIVDERDPRYAELPEHRDAQKLFDVATGKLVKLDANVEEFLSQVGNEAKTKDMKRSTIKRFCEQFPYSSDATKKAVQQWINKEATERGKKAKTITRVLSELRSYWSFLQRAEVVPEDFTPFEKLTVPRVSTKVTKADEREAFSPADVVKLLKAARAGDDAVLGDLIFLGMYTGARIEELCALRVDRVVGNVLKIEDAKTSAGWREVPVHSKLKVTIRRLCRDSKDGYVLSGLTPNKYGDRSNAVGKRFGRLKASLGYGPTRVFHSIRRTVATLFENAGVPVGVAADILGHEKAGDMTYGLYSGGASLETKRKAMEKLVYPN